MSFFVKKSLNKSEPFKKWKIVFIVVLFLSLYIWIAGSNGVPLIVDTTPEHHEQIRTPNLFPDISPHHYGFYNLLADAFEKGRLDLLIDPPKDLTDLPNPQDPVASQNSRILDLALFNKRFYLYFGPVPAIVLFLPFRLLGIGKISEPFAVALFSFGIFLSCLYILIECSKRFIPNVNKFLFVLAILSIGISNVIPYNLRHPVVYETAIASGAFFAILGLAFLLKSWDGIRLKNSYLALCSFSIGLSVGCRPNYVFASFFLMLVIILANYKVGLRSKYIKWNIACSFIPLFIILLLLFIYNFLRFGAINNFGIQYMLGPTQWDYNGCMYRLANILPGVFLNALCPPNISNIFPFIHFSPFYPFTLPSGYSFEEPIAGFLLTSPITLYSLALPFFLLNKNTISNHNLSSLLILFGIQILFFQVWIMFGTTMRYQVDFLPTILLGSIIGSLYWESKIKESLKKSIITTGIALLLCIGILSHLAFGMTGIFDTLRRGEPRQYFALENFFRPVSALLTPFFGSDQTKILDITIPNGSARFEDGTEGPWLGEEGFYVRFTAAQTIPMQFSADVVVHPDLPDGVKLEFQNPTGSSKSSVVKGISRQTFQFTLQPGSNRISIFATPNSPLLKGQDNLRLAVLKNIQIAPVGRN